MTKTASAPSRRRSWYGRGLGAPATGRPGVAPGAYSNPEIGVDGGTATP
ncbi:hypothetical protein [Nonomuraea glycinis]